MSFSRIGKRCIKVTEVGGLDFYGLYVDGTQRPDPDVPMSFIADLRSSNQKIRNVKAVFGSSPAANGIIIERSKTQTIVENIDIDNVTGATLLDSPSNDIIGLVANNIKGKSSRGLSLGRTNLINSSIDNVDVESTDGVGITINKATNSRLSNVNILNGSFTIWAGKYILDNVNIVWNKATGFTERLLILTGEKTEI